MAGRGKGRGRRMLFGSPQQQKKKLTEMQMQQEDESFLSAWERLQNPGEKMQEDHNQIVISLSNSIPREIREKEKSTRDREEWSEWSGSCSEWSCFNEEIAEKEEAEGAAAVIVAATTSNTAEIVKTEAEDDNDDDEAIQEGTEADDMKVNLSFLRALRSNRWKSKWVESCSEWSSEADDDESLEEEEEEEVEDAAAAAATENSAPTTAPAAVTDFATPSNASEPVEIEGAIGYDNDDVEDAAAENENDPALNMPVLPERRLPVQDPTTSFAEASKLGFLHPEEAKLIINKTIADEARLAEKSVKNCYMGACDSLSKFYLTFSEGQFREKMEKLVKGMTERYREASNRYDRPVWQLWNKRDMIQPGGIIACFNRLDTAVNEEEMVRAKILHWVKPSSGNRKDITECKVFCIDIGERMTVSIWDMFLLHEDFALVPAWAIPCRAALSPFYDRYHSGKEEWPQRMNDFMIICLDNAELKVKFLKTLMDKNTGERIWEVTFLDSDPIHKRIKKTPQRPLQTVIIKQIFKAYVDPEKERKRLREAKIRRAMRQADDDADLSLDEGESSIGTGTSTATGKDTPSSSGLSYRGMRERGTGAYD